MASSESQPTAAAAGVGYGTSKGAAFQETLAKVQVIVDDGEKWKDAKTAMNSAVQLLDLLDTMQKLQPANVPVDAFVSSAECANGFYNTGGQCS